MKILKFYEIFEIFRNLDILENFENFDLFWGYIVWVLLNQRVTVISFIDFARECNIIHLLHAGEGNMKIYSPRSIIFPEGNARGEYVDTIT